MKPDHSSTSGASIALYGGSFDPVHCAHLAVARAVLEQVGVDRLFCIPAARSPLKSGQAFASDADRVEMLRLALIDEPRCSVDTRELERGGTSYTVDTVADFRREYPGAALYWVIGGDQLELLPQWRRIEALAQEVTFAVLSRPGHSSTVPAIRGLRIHKVDAPLMEHSSSEIRHRLMDSQQVTGLVPPAVEAFISARGLYTP